MELLDIVDEFGKPTGKVAERVKAHSEGIPHRTAHVWIFRRKGENLEVLLQKRCMEKDSFPGCYDISSAGHIPAGMEVIPSALRELEEELSFRVDEQDLIFCGTRHETITDEFREEHYEDNQFSYIYLLWKDVDEDRIQFQKEEIESVRWMNFEDCKRAVVEGTIPNCIDVEELEMLEEHL